MKPCGGFLECVNELKATRVFGVRHLYRNCSACLIVTTATSDVIRLPTNENKRVNLQWADGEQHGLNVARHSRDGQVVLSILGMQNKSVAFDAAGLLLHQRHHGDRDGSLNAKVSCRLQRGDFGWYDDSKTLPRLLSAGITGVCE